MSSLLQECISWVSSVGVFLNGLQEEGVAGDPLHWHHQEETQRSGVHFRPGGMNGNSQHSDNFRTESNNCYVLLLLLIQLTFFHLQFSATVFSKFGPSVKEQVDDIDLR